MIYGFGGNAGVRKIFPWLASAASKNIKFNTNSDLTKTPKPSYKIRLLELLGQVLMAFSLYEIAVTKPVLSEGFHCPYYPWIFLIMGFALGVPKIIFIIKNRTQIKNNQ